MKYSQDVLVAIRLWRREKDWVDFRVESFLLPFCREGGVPGFFGCLWCLLQSIGDARCKSLHKYHHGYKVTRYFYHKDKDGSEQSRRSSCDVPSRQEDKSWAHRTRGRLRSKSRMFETRRYSASDNASFTFLAILVSSLMLCFKKERK